MGRRATQFFEEAERLGGLPAKMRLASLAKLTSTEASAAADDDVVLGRLEAAAKILRTELDPSRASSALKVGPRTEAATLRRYMKTALELASQRSLFLGDVTQTARRVTEACVAALEVERVSVWFLDLPKMKLTCADLFERTPGKHSSGMEISSKDVSPYFVALWEERTIAAHDAVTDPRTSCFAETYLKPTGIGAMLDVPLWTAGRMAGVLCHEHVGGKRNWTSDEEDFAYLVSTFVALALERATAAT
jgi:GAF domain-containing protein